MLRTVTFPDPPPDAEVLLQVPGQWQYNVYALQATLVAVGPFNLTGETAVDSSGNGRDGTYVGPVSRSALGLVHGDTAVDFADVGGFHNYGGYVLAPAPATLYGADWTLECWVQFTNAEVLQGQIPVLVTDALGVRLTSILALTGTTSFGTRRHPPNADQFVSFGAFTFPNDGLRHHVVVTCTKVGANHTLDSYLDGAHVATNISGIADDVNVAAAALVGGYSLGFGTPPGACGGVVDEAAFYATALSAARVAAHFAAANNFAAYTAAVLADAPTNYYHLDNSLPPSVSAAVLEITDGHNLIQQVTPSDTQLSGVARVFTWLASVGAVSSTPGAITISTPSWSLPAGYTIGTHTYGGQVGFEWSAVTLWFDDGQAGGPGLTIDYHNRMLVP